MTRAECWYVDRAVRTDEQHDVCGAELAWIDGQWVCPEGHTLRQYNDLNPWLRDHITYLQGDPTMRRRYFGDPP